MWAGIRLIRQVNGCCWQGVTWWQWFVRDEDVGDSDLLAGFFSQSRWIWAQSLANQKLGSHPNPAHILKTFSVASLGVWEHWKKKFFVKVQKKRKWKDSFYMLSFLLWWKQCKSSKSWFHIKPLTMSKPNWSCHRLVRQARTLTMCLGSPACSKYGMLTLSKTLGKN